MLWSWELQHLKSVIRWVLSQSMQTIVYILAQFLQSFLQHLNRIVEHHAHRLHGSLELFVRIPCSKAHVSTNLTCILSQNIWHVFLFHCWCLSLNNSTNQLFSFTSSINTSDWDNFLFMDGPWDETSPLKNLNARWRNKSQTVVSHGKNPPLKSPHFVLVHLQYQVVGFCRRVTSITSRTLNGTSCNTKGRIPVSNRHFFTSVQSPVSSFQNIQVAILHRQMELSGSC